MADCECNEDSADELAVVDISTAIKCVQIATTFGKNALKIESVIHPITLKFRLYLSLKTAQLAGNVTHSKHFDVARFDSSDSGADEDLIGLDYSIMYMGSCCGGAICLHDNG
jgi:hypothetical protein